MTDVSDKNRLQQPGEDIRAPTLSLERVERLSSDVFGLKPLKIKQLNGYDDKNFHLIESRLVNNHPYIKSVWPHGYVLKIVNSLEETWFIEAQTELLVFLGSNGISCCEPVKDINGNYLPEENLEKEDGSISRHVIRLLKFQPGILLKDFFASLSMSSLSSCISYSYFFHDLGQKAASLNNVMKKFKNDNLAKKKSLWHLQNAPEVKKYLFAVKDEDKVSLVLRVLEAFEESVVKRLDHIQTGLIHGDLNESNLLVDGTEDDKYRISFILDFNDIHLSAYILELATMMCYVFLETKSLEVGSFILEGYNEIHQLPIDEYKLLPISICARLCQSLVIGIYTYTLDTSNRYVMQTQAAGWEMLYKIMSMDCDTINELWMKNITNDKQ